VLEFTLWEHDHRWLQWSVALIATAIAAATDLKSRRIPNLLTFPLILAGFAWAFAVGGLPALGESTLACIFLGFPFVVLFLFAGGGAGDAKLMGALGAWLGLVGGTVVLTSVAVAGIALAIAHTVAKRRTQVVLSNLAGIATGLLFVALKHGRMEQVPRVESPEAMQTIPYGVAIFAGTVIATCGVVLWNT